ncbi:MAG: hypothetical protein QXX08_07805 [Candidatus Bathyarchaeia archaeon]
MGMLKMVFWEFLLLLVSILVFRSVWTILDKIPAMKNDFEIWVSLILGAAVAFTSIFMINKYAEKQRSRNI